MPVYDLGCHDCDRVTETFIPLADFHKELLPCECGGMRFRRITAPQIMADIQPYQAVASDIATGKPPVIMGRAQHREFLKRNNYTEIGNEPVKPRRDEPVNTREIGRQVKQVIDSKGIKL